jgi:hypothetical protein
LREAGTLSASAADNPHHPRLGGNCLWDRVWHRLPRTYGRDPNRQDDQAQAMHLERLKQIERSVVVQKPAHEAVQIFAKYQLSGEEDRMPELACDLEAKPSKLHNHVGSDCGAQFGMEAQVCRKLAILQQIVGDSSLELP